MAELEKDVQQTEDQINLPESAEAKLSFEEAMQEVERLVRVMENNALSLDETLAAFEKGVRLARFCQEYLEAAEQRIEQVIASASGEPQLRSFQEEAGERHV